MSVSRIILGMATVASLMFNIACEDVDTPCVGTACSSSTVDGGLNQADGGSLDGGKTDADIQASNDSSPDTSTPGPDQTVAEVVPPDVNSDPCAEWRWMEVYQWQCPAAFGKNDNVKFNLSVVNGVCMAKSIIMKKKATELICNKEEKKFIFLEEQDNNKEVHCQIIEG